MPVIRIQALRAESLQVANLLIEVSGAVAEAFGIDVEQCWSCFTEIRPGEYLEGGRLRGLDGDTQHSPLVTVTAYEGRSAKEIAAALNGVAEAVIANLGMEKGDVFVEFHELRAGQVYTGGSVR